MNLNEPFPVSPQKKEALLKKMADLGISPGLIEESFTRGGGKGGQKINKTSNAVRLFYAPLSIAVKVQRERQRSLNRFLALRELVEQIEMKVSPQTSSRVKGWSKIRKQKERHQRRTSHVRA
jgi:protein subunit release factor B